MICNLLWIALDQWVNGYKFAKKELTNIVEFIKKEYEDIKIRVAFVGYRDFCDKNY